MLGLLNDFAAAAAPCLNSGGCETGLPTAAASGATLHTLLQIVFTTMGAIAVLMIVISGVNFINAQGDPSKVTRARHIIMYALIGLVIAISADVLVSFILGGF